jgi:GntR family transcriptional regulator
VTGLGPLADRISNELERRIVTGVYGPGDKLPSEAALCTEFDVSRPTLRDALSRLEALGFICRHQGRGTFVEERPTPGISTLLEANLSVTAMIERMGLRPGTRDVTARHEAPDEPTARALKLGERDAVLVVRRVRTANDVPVVLSVDYLAPWIPGLPLTADAYGGSLYELLRDCCGEPVTAALARIEPLRADATVASRLAVPGGHLLLALHQLHELADGRPVLSSVEYLRSDVFTVYVKRVIEPVTDAEPQASDTPSRKRK